MKRAQVTRLLARAEELLQGFGDLRGHGVLEHVNVVIAAGTAALARHDPQERFHLIERLAVFRGDDDLIAADGHQHRRRGFCLRRGSGGVPPEKPSAPRPRARLCGRRIAERRDQAAREQAKRPGSNEDCLLPGAGAGGFFGAAGVGGASLFS